MSQSTQKFKTEVQQLLHLMIHSLYSNRDIFLRELIANAADAIDKARFESLTDQSLGRDWAINLSIDKEKRIFTISDNGIGMTRDEVIENIGTIAKSGTRAFMKALEEKKAGDEDLPELIGQFGVGFYSAFMVADKVELLTRRAGSTECATLWSSDGTDSYTVEDAERSEAGTTITLYLKEDAEVYTDDWKISDIVHRYSDFIEYPIILPMKKYAPPPAEGEEAPEPEIENKVLNSKKAIWLRKPSEITDEEHQSFFSHLSHGGKYLKAIHISAEGTSEFKALLYLPEKMPVNFFFPEIQKKGLQLYVRRVFITDECQELVPDYLRFLKGVVDSADLPLNVSREILQENPMLAKIQKALVSRVLNELKKLQENDKDKYTEFFREFGKILKEGIHMDFANQEKIKDLAMYESMNTGAGQYITLADYVAAMPEDQECIYFITGEKRSAVESNPALERYRSKGYDVLFMTDPIDEWVMQSMMQYKQKHFKSVTKGELEVSKDEKDALDAKIAGAAEKYAGVVEAISKQLAATVETVRFSGRLTDSPCCLVGDAGSMSPHLERLFKAMNQDMPSSKRVLELNPDHAIFDILQKKIDKDASDPTITDYIAMLYDTALLAEGSPITDPADFVKRIASLMSKG